MDQIAGLILAAEEAGFERPQELAALEMRRQAASRAEWHRKREKRVPKQ